MVVSRGDEYQPSAGGDCPTVVQGSGAVDALGFELGIGAERNLPGYVTCVDVDRLQLAPRRLLAWPELVVVPESRVESPWTGSDVVRLCVWRIVFDYLSHIGDVRGVD